MIKIDVSVIAPAHNEEEIVENFLKEVLVEARKIELNFELLIVENGSIDNTSDIVKKYLKNNSEIKLLQLKKAGYGLALKKGIEKSKGKYLVVFNIDFWDKRFLSLTKVDLLGYDMISGSKLLPGSVDNRKISRKFVSFMLNQYLRLILGYKGTDTHGIKLIKKESVLPILKKCKTSSGIFDSELVIRMERNNLKILELPVNVSEIRKERFGFNRLLKTPEDLFNLWKVLR